MQRNSNQEDCCLAGLGLWWETIWWYYATDTCFHTIYCILYYHLGSPESNVSNGSNESVEEMEELKVLNDTKVLNVL